MCPCRVSQVRYGAVEATQKYKKLRIGKELSDTKDWKSSTTKEINQQDESDAKRYKPGKLLSCDNVGPVNPNSFEGYVQSFIWRDTSTNRNSDKEASEDVYLEGLEIIHLYYKRHGIKIKVIRSDDFTTFKSTRTMPSTVLRVNPAHPTNIGRTQSRGTSRR